MADIQMPKLGMSMTEATLTEWLIPDGGDVAEGQDLYAVETDKSVQEIQSPVSGKLTIIAQPGELFQVGDLLARVE
jgi:pyruvate/2-oxoglutarate dehydrogenase complex dihydrolipoamide acyltransferase (E2) component